MDIHGARAARVAAFTKFRAGIPFRLAALPPGAATYADRSAMRFDDALKAVQAQTESADLARDGASSCGVFISVAP
jgi:hypothetical protein